MLDTQVCVKTLSVQFVQSVTVQRMFSAGEKEKKHSASEDVA